MLELNPSLVFPVLEMLLGGTGQSAQKPDREITEIEQSILDGLLRIILNDLRAAWHAVADIDFEIESHETEPQLLQLLENLLIFRIDVIKIGQAEHAVELDAASGQLLQAGGARLRLSDPGAAGSDVDWRAQVPR